MTRKTGRASVIANLASKGLRLTEFKSSDAILDYIRISKPNFIISYEDERGLTEKHNLIGIREKQICGGNI